MDQLELYEEAVTLALQADIPLAKRVIQQARASPACLRPTHQAAAAAHRHGHHHLAQQLPPHGYVSAEDCGSLENLPVFFVDFVRTGETAAQQTAGGGPRGVPLNTNYGEAVLTSVVLLTSVSATAAVSVECGKGGHVTHVQQTRLAFHLESATY